MIKRKNGVKKTVAMVIVLVMLAITTLPAHATSNIIEVTVLENFIVQVKNPTNEEYSATVKVYYYNENEEIIYQKEIIQDLNALETVEIDAKEYFNSSKTQTVETEVYSEGLVSTLKKAKIVLNFHIISVIMCGIFFICGLIPTKKYAVYVFFVSATTIAMGLWLITGGILLGICLGNIT